MHLCIYESVRVHGRKKGEDFQEMITNDIIAIMEDFPEINLLFVYSDFLRRVETQKCESNLTIHTVEGAQP